MFAMMLASEGGQLKSASDELGGASPAFGSGFMPLGFLK